MKKAEKYSGYTLSCPIYMVIYMYGETDLLYTF